MSAEDPFDVEALLEAPYRKQSNGGDRSSSEEEPRSRSKKHRRRSYSRSRSRSRDRDDRRDRDRDRGRGKDRHQRSGRHRDYDRDYDRYRSHSQERDRRDRDRDRRDRDRDRDRDRHDRSRDGDRPRDNRERPRAQTPEEERARKERSRKRRELLKDAEKLSPEERDVRTVFCMQLAKGIREEDLEDFFSVAGTVVDVRLISDRNSRRSKGIAYVEFLTTDSLPKAISLTGQKVKGVPIMVQTTQSEKNRLAQVAQTLQKPPGFNRLYVGSLHFNITEAMLNAIFAPFGQIESVTIQKDADTGRSKGYGFVQFKNAESARQALDQLNGFELAGRPIKVGNVTERGENQAMGFLDDDDTDRGGVDMTSSTRAALMAKLAAGHQTGFSVPTLNASLGGLGGVMPTSLAANPIAAAGLMGAAGLAGLGGLGGGLAGGLVQPSPCFMLQNMFDPANESGGGWEMEIRDEVLEEAVKHGDVMHIHVDKAAPQGIVYVKCRDSTAAALAMKALHGRFFGGKQIQAVLVPEYQYHALFPASIGAFTPLKPRGR